MTNKLKIAICSKGRGGSKFIEKLNRITYQAVNIGSIYQHALDNDIHELDNVYLFIEPQEIKQYAETYSKWPKSNLVVLGDNDQGLAYTRQTALQFFQDKMPTEWICMLDDDAILYQYEPYNNPEKPNKKWCMVKRDLVAGLQDCFEYLMKLPETDQVGIAALEYNHYSWSKEKDFPLDGSFISEKFSNIGSNHSYCDCIVFWRPLLYKKIGVSYDNFPLKADRDFAFQIAFAGYYNRKIFKFIMDSPLNGKAAGGCKSWYDKEDQEHDEIIELHDKWDNVHPKSDLTHVKEKKTSYGRAWDLKWWWSRAYHARVRNLITREVHNIHPISESVNNYHTYE